MGHVESSNNVHALLTERVSDIAAITNDDGDMAEMRNPVLTEWVLVANVLDLESDEVRLTILAAPNMLYSHVVGLLAVAGDL